MLYNNKKWQFANLIKKFQCANSGRMKCIVIDEKGKMQLIKEIAFQREREGRMKKGRSRASREAEGCFRAVRRCLAEIFLQKNALPFLRLFENLI